MKKQTYKFNEVEINTGEQFGVKELYDYLGEDYHDVVSYKDYLEHDVAANSLYLNDENGNECEILLKVENEIITITEIVECGNDYPSFNERLEVAENKQHEAVEQCSSKAPDMKDEKAKAAFEI